MTQTTLSDGGDEVVGYKNPETLRKLYHDEDLNQGQIAERFDTTTSTISYWMDKLGVSTTHNDRGSISYSNAPCEKCGGETPGEEANNQMCDDCLDEARNGGHGRNNNE